MSEEIKVARHAKFETDGTEESMGLLQAAFYLKMHPSYVRNLVKDGTIVAEKVANRWTVKRADLDTYLEVKASTPRARSGGAKQGYVPAAVAGVRRTISMVETADIGEEDRVITLEVLNAIHEAVVVEWEARKAAKAAEAETEVTEAVDPEPPAEF